MHQIDSTTALGRLMVFGRILILFHLSEASQNALKMMDLIVGLTGLVSKANAE
jgi:hypothetical protein